MPGTIPSPVGNDDNWQAESDADTLATASEIIGDPERLNAAKTAAVNMATEKMEQVRTLMTITGRSFNQSFAGMDILADQSSIQ